MDTGVELVGIKDGVGLFYKYSEGTSSIERREIPLQEFKDREYSCRNFKVANTDNTILFNGQRFSSIEAMIQDLESLIEADAKSETHTKNGWYFL